MRNLFALLFLFLTGCTNATYEIYVEYQDSTKDTLRSRSNTYPYLTDGCIQFHPDGAAVRCGVKAFTYKTLNDEPKGVH